MGTMAKGRPVDTNALFCIFHRQAPRDGLKASFRDHRERPVYSGDGMIRLRGGDIDDASTDPLRQHLLDHALGDENKAFNVDGKERAQVIDRVIGKMLREIDAGVVDERVDSAKSGQSRRDDVRSGARVADVSIDQRKTLRRRKGVYLGNGPRARHDALTTLQERFHGSRADAL